MASLNFLTRWKTLVQSWLSAVTALTAVVGTRIYQTFPPIPVIYPCVTHNLGEREPVHEHGFPAFNGVLDVYLFSASQDQIDTMELGLVDYVDDNSEAILTSLTAANVVQTVRLIYVGSQQDPNQSFETEANVTIFCRVVRFAVTVTKHWS